MAEKKLAILRAKMQKQMKFVPVSGGRRDKLKLPSVNSKQKYRDIENQLVSLAQEVAKRQKDQRVQDAEREIIAVHPMPGYELDADKLASQKEDVRVVSVDPDTGTALVDAPSAELKFLKKKLDEYIDDQKISEKTKLRRNATALEPLESITLADLQDRAGAIFRGLNIPEGTSVWFELACRGGRRMPKTESEGSRKQIKEALRRIKHDGRVQEFESTERILFYIPLTVKELAKLVGMVDCVYEIEFSEPQIRDFLILEYDEPELVKKAKSFKLSPPDDDAPSVVLLDSGLASKHPLLKDAILTQDSVVPEDSSPEDSTGHGTQMAGVALYHDLGEAITNNAYDAPHWLQSVRVIGPEISKEKNRPFWPKISENAIAKAESEPYSRPRVFVSAVTADLDTPRDTSWSGAFDQLTYNGGSGRLIMISIGNIRDWNETFVSRYPRSMLKYKVEDPAQSANALTVGAYTRLTTLPPADAYEEYEPIAPENGASPHSRTGHSQKCIKPDLVLEGGNIGWDGNVADPTIPTLTTLTTGRDFRTHPLHLMYATSGATAHAGRIAAKVWAANPDLRPESIRALLVHSCKWTKAMHEQFPDLDDRLAVCGYGAPNLGFATYCTQHRATVLIESDMPNRLESGDNKDKRVAKLFELPVPNEDLIALGEKKVSLRVTLSYFAEPNTVKDRTFRGMNLKWDMQGPAEKDKQFFERINKELRASDYKNSATESFDWDIGIQRRSRGTIQSDRWTGRAIDLAGAKWIAVYPITGWWDDRKSTRFEKMRFSLVMSVECPDLDIYTPIQNVLQPELLIDAT